ncbi:mitochondrial fission 1 protein-like [Watersipora subatra]|uniref:mitochondrial fission 1 protein-like n=1 Tax=Watersipora subatra TaxID=2589382 RepID=UPI00355C4434
MASMVLDEMCDPSDLKRYDTEYHLALSRGSVDVRTKFQYAWCLVRTRNNSNLQKGSDLLQDLFRNSNSDGEKRDYLYYMVVACTKLKEYEKALKYADGILKVQPNNHQVLELKKEIDKRMKRDGLIGMAVAGGAAAVVGAGIATLIGVAIAKR